MVNWRGLRNWKFSLGKGKLRFHQVSYGVNESSYIDGGSLLGTYHSFRDQDRKIMGEVAYGGYRTGFKNTFAVYADSSQPRVSTRSDSGFYVDDDKFLIYQNEKEIDTRADYGLVNQFSLYPFRGLQMSLGALLRDREADANKNYAFDFNGKYKTGDWEYIWEYAFAYVSTHPNDQYSVEHQYEQMAQFQTLYKISDITKLQLNLEAAFVRGQSRPRASRWWWRTGARRLPIGWAGRVDPKHLWRRSSGGTGGRTSRRKARPVATAGRPGRSGLRVRLAR